MICPKCGHKEEKKPDGGALVILLFGALMLVLIALLGGHAVATQSFKREAVLKGKAEWGSNAEGNSEWRWKP